MKELLMINSHLPDYRSKEENVLYIIGNGFDLYHGLSTSYKDFRNWLLQDHSDFVEKMQKIYPKVKDKDFLLWSEFESALGKPADLLYLHQLFGGSDTVSLSKEEQKTHAAKIIKETLGQVCPLLYEWVQTFQTGYANVQPLLPLGKNSRYITFNYTMVLENVYHIVGENILHIHGSADNPPVITGYEMDLTPTVYGNPIEEISQRNIYSELAKLRKKTEIIFDKHNDFFEDLAGVSIIVVIGHSLADVDLAYIKYLAQLLPQYPNVSCQYWVHDEEAKDKVKKLINGICRSMTEIEDKMPESNWTYQILDKLRNDNNHNN
ncbi:MAG: bacteriophage abortive infection AbiH family protein [Prevotella sp.]|nr:bacteriophage abortive infection AbiH family protein [Prevotella sp.]